MVVHVALQVLEILGSLMAVVAVKNSLILLAEVSSEYGAHLWKKKTGPHQRNVANAAEIESLAAALSAVVQQID